MSLGTVQNLHATLVTATRVTLAWNRVAGAGFYGVWRNAVYAFDTGALTLSDGTVAPQTAYVYTVRARTAKEYGAFSAPLSVLTPALPPAVPPTPTGLSVTLAATQPAAVLVGWVADPTTTSIDVYRNGVLVASGVSP